MSWKTIAKPTVFIKIFSDHKYNHLLTYCLQLFLHYNRRVENFNRDFMASKAKKITV